MINKNTIKNILLSLVVMGIMSVITLLILSALTYSLKWQAPQAMVGITLTYILSGLAGGVLQGVLDRSAGKGLETATRREAAAELQGRMISGLLLGTSYMIILLILSIIFTENENWDVTRLIMIWILLVCSSVLGGVISNIFSKNR